MTTLLDTPAPTRKERTMLKRKMAATAEPDTDSAIVLPAAGEQESTIVVTDNTDPEQAAEVVTDTGVEAAAEPSVPAEADDDDVFAMPEPRTGGLPMVAFKPLQKDMSADDDEVPYAPPMTSNRFFADDDDDEWGIQVDRSAIPTRVRTEEEQEAFDRELDAKAAAAEIVENAKKQALKEKQAKDEAKRLARIEKRGSRRMLGTLMMAGGALSVLYGLVVTYVPGM